MNHRWLLRMARWAQNPPSDKRVVFVLGIAAVCIALFLIERYVGWPDYLSPDPKSHRWKP